MVYRNSVLHLTNENYDENFTVIFTYDFDNDRVIINDLGKNNNWCVLEGIYLEKLIRYAMLNQNYNNYVYGLGDSKEFEYSIEEYYETTHESKNENQIIEEKPVIMLFKTKIKCLKPKVK